MKRRIGMFLAAAMTAVCAQADTWTDPDTGYTWTYRINGDGAEIYGHQPSSTAPAISPSPTGAVDIPSTLGGKPVNRIGDGGAFYHCVGLASVTIPDSVTSIGMGAFYNCSGLTNVTIGGGVTSIWWNAFHGCTRRRSFIVSENNPSYCSINGLLLTKDCKTLLYGVNGDVRIPDSVTYISSEAFSGCSELTSFIVSENNPNYCSVNGLLLTKDGRTLFQGVNGDVTIPDSVTSISGGAFSGCSGLTSVVIPDTVTSISWEAFSGCSGLTSVTIPGSVTSVEGYAFDGCSGLTSVIIPDSVTDIEYSVFSGCSGLTSFIVSENNPNYCSVNGLLLTKDCKTLLYGANGDVTIPDSVTSIEDYAFYGYSGLTSVTMQNNVTNIGCDAFYDCSGLTSVTIPQYVCDMGFYGVFPSSSAVANIVIADGVTEICDWAFGDCYSVRTVIIPSSVTNIGSCAFASCIDLENVVISNSHAIIQADAFLDCISLRSATLPVSALQSSYATPGIPLSIRQALTNIVFCNGTTKIESLAGLADSTALKSVTIPSSVTRVGDCVFKDCAALTDVYFEGDAPDMGADVFLGTPRSLVVHVQDGSIGWTDDFSDTLPSSWNGRRIAYTSDSGSGGSGSSGGGSSGGGATASTQVALTVTNVVVHYVLNSVVPEDAAPVSGDTGFVTVVTEIKGGAVAVAESWAENYPTFAAKFGSDFATALTKPSGKHDSQGNALMVWQDYVAGTDPTDETDVFQASITLVDGVPQVSYTPELPEAEKAKRKYTIYGKARLQDKEWSVVDGDSDKYNFFKVTVEMR